MKISTKLISTSAIMLLAMSSSTSVFAAKANSTATSTGKIGLVADPDQSHPGGGNDGGDGQDPDNPTDPDHPGDGNGNDNTGNKGDFTLDTVPNYNFGEQTIDGKAHTYNASFWDASFGALIQGRNANPYVQVTDLRTNNTGWHVSVRLDTPFETSSKKELTGAVLNLPQGYATATDSTNTSNLPETNAVTANNSDQILMYADNDGQTGVGSWMDKMYTDPENNTMATTLDVPAGNSAGEYSTSIVWTLADTPQA